MKIDLTYMEAKDAFTILAKEKVAGNSSIVTVCRKLKKAIDEKEEEMEWNANARDNV